MGILYFGNWIFFRRDGLRAEAMRPMKANESYWIIPGTVEA